MNDTLTQLSQHLMQTLSPDAGVRKSAEKYLESIEANEGFGPLLLQLVDCNQLHLTVRMSGAIVFKNVIKRNWPQNEDITNKISENDRNQIKSVIIDLMLKSPEQIQRQLSDAVSIIGREDFPDKWPNLLDDMITRMGGNEPNFNIINGVLQTAHSLFKRYRHEFRSDELWTEIKYVLSRFAEPFTKLFVWTVDLAKTHANNTQNLKVIFSSLVLCAKIFNSLNTQDLPEYFEDNMSVWMKHFLELLSTDYKSLHTDNDEEAGPLEQLKSQICDNIGMYASKYNEEFEPYLPGFVESVWNLLITTGAEPKYDILVSNAIHFLSSVADRSQYSNLFKANNVLDSISSKIIVPNMEFRVSDEELFEDNPEEYIRRDIEGSDVDTRRRAACDLVKSLSRYFEKEMTQVFSQYIQLMLQKYAENPLANWRNKDAVIYLVTSLSVKTGTSRLGATSTSDLVNITEFYVNVIRPDLERQNLNETPVLRADGLKYLMTFRNQLSLKEIIIPSLPLIIQHMTAPNVVVHTYAAHVLEKLLTMRDSTQQKLPSIKVEDLDAYIGPLLNGLFNILTFAGSNENEYAMKAIMRTFSLLQERCLPYFAQLLPKLTAKLAEVTKNPTKPHFNHYLFEALSLTIRIGCRKDRSLVSNFESILFPIFQEILIQDVQEFMPYVFQLLSLLLEMYDKSIAEPYMELFPHLLTPILWERPANIAPLVRLLQAFIEKGSEQIIDSSKLQPLLGVFQKLIASKTNDNQGFYILQSLIEFASAVSLEPYMKQVFIILFQRLTSSKTTKYIKCLLVFFSLFIYKYGVQTLADTIDSLQQRMFGMVLEKLFIPEVQKVSGSVEKKILAFGMTKILCELDSTIIGQYSQFWAPLLQSLVALFELPVDESVPDDEHFVEIEDTFEYQASYSQLVFAGHKERDPLEGLVSDSRIYLAQSLSKLSTKHPGKLNPLISTGLPPDAITYLQRYCMEANITIS
ncbi:exportin-2-like [Oppia nitens]|uniref:exportin-2-like n=1 Tax=Oppia nitens TaxID=1686743 RepID=UPI0023DA3FE2|nr:exportin-2-like [Oppia nitens]